MLIGSVQRLRTAINECSIGAGDYQTTHVSNHQLLGVHVDNHVTGHTHVARSDVGYTYETKLNFFCSMRPNSTITIVSYNQ